MLPRDQIESAVEIQHKSYDLLLWLGSAIDSGLITFARSHRYANPADTTYEWFNEHYDYLPEAFRPERERLRPFCNYFGSYVTTSFDLVDRPGSRLESSCGCFCELCARLVNASHLRPKRLRQRDKDADKEKRISRVIRLAQEAGLPVSNDFAAGIAAGPFLRDAAYSAYGEALLERIAGSEGGPYLLALWRQIAWKPEGSPIKGFRLAATDIFQAELQLVAELERLSQSHRSNQ